MAASVEDLNLIESAEDLTGAGLERIGGIECMPEVKSF